ncbi:hypothetical protein SKAU_G00254560, partial [Synaphobranchus kaupii]
HVWCERIRQCSSPAVRSSSGSHEDLNLQTHLEHREMPKTPGEASIETACGTLVQVSMETLWDYKIPPGTQL